jgi:hypothetical protein
MSYNRSIAGTVFGYDLLQRASGSSTAQNSERRRLAGMFEMLLTWMPATGFLQEGC